MHASYRANNPRGCVQRPWPFKRGAHPINPEALHQEGFARPDPHGGSAMPARSAWPVEGFPAPCFERHAQFGQGHGGHFQGGDESCMFPALPRDPNDSRDWLLEPSEKQSTLLVKTRQKRSIRWKNIRGPDKASKPVLAQKHRRARRLDTKGGERRDDVVRDPETARKCQFECCNGSRGERCEPYAVDGLDGVRNRRFRSVHGKVTSAANESPGNHERGEAPRCSE